MKTLRLFSAALGLLAVGAFAAATPRTEVIFDHPENFTDVRDRQSPTDKGRDYILSQLRDHLVDVTSRLVPDGDKLMVTFSDIKLAGDFEPWRGPQWDEVRIIKDIYVPFFKFTYTVTDPSGRVVKSGTENIQDMNFQMRVTLDTSDPLRYEKQILDDWARGTLRDLKKT